MTKIPNILFLILVVVLAIQCDFGREDVEKPNDSSIKIFPIQFFYHSSNNDAYDYLDTYWESDLKILNNYFDSLGLNYNFKRFEKNVVIEDNKLLSDALADSPANGQIRVYLDSLRIREEEHNHYDLDLDFIWWNKDDFGSIPIFTHELIHKLLRNGGNSIKKDADHVTNGSLSTKCNTTIKNSCVNLMTDRITWPLHIFLSDRQVSWINEMDQGSSVVDMSWCNTHNPVNWSNAANEDLSINDAYCCTFERIELKDVVDVLKDLLEEEAKNVFQVAEEIVSILFSCNSVAIQENSEGKEHPNVFASLDLQIDAIKDSVLALFVKPNAEYAELKIWDHYFELAKSFVLIWFKQTAEYQKRLKLECALLVQGVEGLSKEDYYNRRKEEVLKPVQRIQDYISSFERTNISTGYSETENKPLKSGVDQQWRLVKTPKIGFYSSKPMDAYVCDDVSSWRNIAESKWISSTKNGRDEYDKRAKSCDSSIQPYTFEKSINIVTAGTFRFNYDLLHDGYCGMSIKGPENFREQLYQSCNKSSYKKPRKVQKMFYLEKGVYTIKCSIYKSRRTFGFNVDGYVEGPPGALDPEFEKKYSSNRLPDYSVKPQYGEFNWIENPNSFGRILKGNQETIVVKFVNSGKYPLTINDVISKPCIEAAWPKDPIAPRRKGKITLTFNSASVPVGEDRYSVEILANAGQSNRALFFNAEVFKDDKPKIGKFKWIEKPSLIEIGRNETKTVSLLFENIGNESIIIENIKSDLFSVQAWDRNPFLPGTKGKIQLTLDSKRLFKRKNTTTLILEANTEKTNRILNFDIEIVKKK